MHFDETKLVLNNYLAFYDISYVEHTIRCDCLEMYTLFSNNQIKKIIIKKIKIKKAMYSKLL